MVIIQEFKDGNGRINKLHLKLTQERQKEYVEKYMETINDSIVKASSFYPLIMWGGYRKKTHSLINDTYGNIVFKIKIQAIFIKIIIIPVIVVLQYIIPLIITDTLSSKIILDQLYFLLLIYTIIIIFIYKLSYIGEGSKIFDFQNGYFYNKKHQKKFRQLLNQEKYRTQIIPIEKIYALQILSVYIRNGYINYELNAILKDSSRVNIVIHGELDEIRNNAQILSEKLGVRVYDLTLTYIDYGYNSF